MSNAGCIRSRSDSEPTRMPTTISDMGDVATELHAGEIYACCGVICGSARSGDRVAERGDVEDASAVRDEPPVVQRRAGIEDERARGLGVGDALDWRAGVAALRVVATGEHDRDGSLLRNGKRHAGKAAGCGGGERLEQVAL